MKKIEGLIPAVVQNADTGEVLMLAYMNQESLDQTLATRLVTFFSRSRDCLWVKGETSGNHLDLVDIREDCDKDALLVRARPRGPSCHTGARTCFLNGSFTNEVESAPRSLAFLNELQTLIDSRFREKPEGSYVSRLIGEGIDRMAQKVGEEGVETVIAAKNPDPAPFLGEAADLIFHLMVLLRARGHGLDEVVELLRTRHAERASTR